MKTLSIIFLCLFSFALSYKPENARYYAYKYWETPNHKCYNYLHCNPYAYFGNEACGYENHGGDSANFVSQCLIYGAHPYLSGTEYCTGNPCGREVSTVKNLQWCLIKPPFKWRVFCGNIDYPPPKQLNIGDVLIFRNDSSNCRVGDGHAALVTEVTKNDQGDVTGIKVTCHSPNMKDVDYKYFLQTLPWVTYILYNGA